MKKSFYFLLLLLLSACGSPYPTKLEGAFDAYLSGRDTSEFVDRFSPGFDAYMKEFLSKPSNVSDLVFEVDGICFACLVSPMARYKTALSFPVGDTLPEGTRLRVVGFSGRVPLDGVEPEMLRVRYFPAELGVLLGLYEYTDLKIEVLEYGDKHDKK